MPNLDRDLADERSPRNARDVDEHPFAMAMLCDLLWHRGDYKAAMEMGLAATAADPTDIEVRDLVASSLSRAVPKWHRPMLNDGARNQAYARAIRDLIKPGMVVLEIGSGAGLLSLMAAQLGAHVYTCEANKMVAAAAQVIATRNGFSNHIHVIPKLSSELQIGVDLPRKADVLMSELFDDTLFGDGIVEFIDDAKTRLLSPGAMIIPRKSALQVALIDVELPAKHRPLETIEGFDLSAFNILAPQPSSYLRVQKHHAILRSAAQSALSKDYEQPTPFGSDQELVELVSCGGRVSGVAQWLRVEFSDGNVFENMPSTTDPSHWGSPVTPFSEAIETIPGQIVSVNVRRMGRRVLYRV